MREFILWSSATTKINISLQTFTPCTAASPCCSLKGASMSYSSTDALSLPSQVDEVFTGRHQKNAYFPWAKIKLSALGLMPFALLCSSVRQTYKCYICPKSKISKALPCLVLGTAFHTKHRPHQTGPGVSKHHLMRYTCAAAGWANRVSLSAMFRLWMGDASLVAAGCDKKSGCSSLSLSIKDDRQGSLRTASNFFMNLKRVLAPHNDRWRGKDGWKVRKCKTAQCIHIKPNNLYLLYTWSP